MMPSNGIDKLIVDLFKKVQSRIKETDYEELKGKLLLALRELADSKVKSNYLTLDFIKFLKVILSAYPHIIINKDYFPDIEQPEVATQEPDSIDELAQLTGYSESTEAILKSVHDGVFHYGVNGGPPDQPLELLCIYFILNVLSQREINENIIEMGIDCIGKIASYYSKLSYSHFHILFSHIFSCFRAIQKTIMTSAYNKESENNLKSYYSDTFQLLINRHFQIERIQNGIYKHFMIYLQPEIKDDANGFIYLKRLCKVLSMLFQLLNGTLGNYKTSAFNSLLDLYNVTRNIEVLELLPKFTDSSVFDFTLYPDSKILQQTTFESILIYSSLASRMNPKLSENEKSIYLKYEKTFSNVLDAAKKTDFRYNVPLFLNIKLLAGIVESFYHFPPFSITLLKSLSSFLSCYIGAHSRHSLIQKLNYDFKYSSIQSQILILRVLIQLIIAHWEGRLNGDNFSFNIIPEISDPFPNSRNPGPDGNINSMEFIKMFKSSRGTRTPISYTSLNKDTNSKLKIEIDPNVAQKIESMKLDGSSHSKYEVLIIAFVACSFQFTYAKLLKEGKLEIKDFLAFSEIYYQSSRTLNHEFFCILEAFYKLSLDVILFWLKNLNMDDDILSIESISDFIKDLGYISFIVSKFEDHPIKLDNIMNKVFSLLWHHQLATKPINFENEKLNGAMDEAIKLSNSDFKSLFGNIEHDMKEIENQELVYNNILLYSLMGFSTLNLETHYNIRMLCLIHSLSFSAPKSFKIEAHRLSPLFICKEPFISENKFKDIIFDFFKPSGSSLELDIVSTRNLGLLTCSSTHMCDIDESKIYKTSFPNIAVCKRCDRAPTPKQFQNKFNTLCLEDTESNEKKKEDALLIDSKQIIDFDWDPYFKYLESSDMVSREYIMNSFYRIISHCNTIDLSQEVPLIIQISLKFLLDVNPKVRSSSYSILLKVLEHDEDERVFEYNYSIITYFIKEKLEESELSVKDRVIYSKIDKLALNAPEKDLAQIFEMLFNLFMECNDFISKPFIINIIQSIERMKGISLMKILEPLWAQLMPTIIKDLRKGASLINCLKELMGIFKKDFLSIILPIALPRVISQHNDSDLSLLSKQLENTTDKSIIAQNRANICIDHMGHIFAAIFISTQNCKENIEYLIKIISCGKREKRVVEYIKLCINELVLALVFELGNEDEQYSNKALNALNFVVQLLNKENEDKHKESLATLLDSMFMTIATDYNLQFQNVGDSNLNSLHLNRIRAIGKVTKIIQHKVIKYNHQIHTILRTLINFKKHRTLVLQVWKTYLFVLKNESLGSVTNMTVTTLSNIYSEFLPPQKNIVLEILNNLFTRHTNNGLNAILDIKTTLSEDVDKTQYYHNLAMISLLPNEMEEFNIFNGIIKHIREIIKPESYFNLLINSLNQESRAGREGALGNLYLFLNNNRSKILEWAQEEPSRKCIIDVVKQLMFILYNHNLKEDEETAYLVGCCLGIIGAIDPNRFKFDKKVNNELTNFIPNDRESCINLASYLLKDKLLGLYKKSETIDTQICFAYCFHNLMNLCGFLDPDIESKKNNQIKPLSTKLWNSYPKNTKDLLKPFIKIDLVAKRFDITDLNHPCYHSDMQFSKWVRKLVTKLIAHISGKFNSQIFKPCYYVCDQFIDFSLYLFPYLALAVIFGDNNKLKGFLINEITNLLDEWPNVDTNNNVNLDKCYIQLILNIIQDINHYRYNYKYKLFDNYFISPKKDVKLLYDFIKEDENYIKLNSFMDQIPLDNVYSAAKSSGNYYDALFYLEQYIDKQKNIDIPRKKLNILYNDLHHIYSKLGDEDNLRAVTNLLETTTFEQQLLEDEATMDWASIQTTFEFLARGQPKDLKHQIGFSKHLQKLGCYELAKKYISGVLDPEEKSELQDSIKQIYDECCWRLCSWDDPESYLNDDNSGSVDRLVGKALLSVKGKYKEETEGLIISTRKLLLPDLMNSIEKSYTTSYNNLVWFHQLDEFEDFNKSLLSSRDVKSQLKVIEKKTNEWRMRSNIISPDYKFQEKVLNFHSSMLSVYSKSIGLLTNSQLPEITNSINKALASNLLKRCKISRKEGYSQVSLNIIKQFPKVDNPLFEIELAKWHWSQNNQAVAINLLSKKLSKYKDKISNKQVMDLEKNDISKMQLLLIKYKIKTKDISHQEILDEFKKVIESDSNRGKLNYIATIYMFEQLEEDFKVGGTKVDNNSCLYKILYAAEHALNCLTYSSKYVYQLLSRILTLWLDYCNQANYKESKYIIDKINEKMKEIAEILPSYQFLSIFSQIISRISIDSEILYNILKTMIIRTIKSYPQQTFWLMISSIDSTDSTRKRRCKEIIDIVNVDDNIKFNYEELNKFKSILLKVSTMETERGKCYDLSKSGLRYNNQPIKVILPIERQLKFKLHSSYNSMDSSNYNPLQETPITISKIMTKIKVMNTMMKPIKLTALGSDGKYYSFLCKPKDDIRKDSRFLELCNILNQLFQKYPGSKKRNINIKTFTALPLNEFCGIIEWVDDTVGIKQLIDKEHQITGVDTSLAKKELTQNQKNSNLSYEERTRKFENQILPLAPPVLHNWFLKRFPNPEEWYNARMNFTQSLAVMSIVGYIVGLGDRHLDNILIDVNTAKVIHIDFGYMFEFGMQLEVPETVPFRLTHNLIKVFGAAGCEGTFQSTCKVVLEIMRDNTKLLTSQIETFLHDPLVDFTKSRGKRQLVGIGLEDINDQKEEFYKKYSKVLPYPHLPKNAPLNSIYALWCLKRISDKLNGNTGSSNISVKGQVAKLIKSATDLKKLSNMYFGWGPYL